MEPNLWFAIVGLIGAAIGASGAIAGQWINAKHTERIERNRWEQQKAKEVRQAIREYRKERARPVLDALDRASSISSISWGDIEALMQEIGYYGEKIEPEEKEAYEKESRKRLRERLDKLVDDMSSVGRIPDPEIRKVLYRALWKGVTRPDSYEVEYQKVEYLKGVDDAYKKLEAWIAMPPAGEY